MQDDDDMIRELHRRLEEAKEFTDALEADNETTRARVAELEATLRPTPVGVALGISGVHDPKRHWMIYCEDDAVSVEIFDCKASATEVYRRRLDNWTCHLFEQVDYNGRPLPDQSGKGVR